MNGWRSTKASDGDGDGIADLREGLHPTSHDKPSRRSSVVKPCPCQRTPTATAERPIASTWASALLEWSAVPVTRNLCAFPRWKSRSLVSLVASGLLLSVGCGRIGFAEKTGQDAGGLPDDSGVDAGIGDADIGAQVTVSLVSGGRVVSTPAGIDCPGTCTASFESGTSLRLDALDGAPAPQVFQNWSSDCSGNSPRCDLIVGDGNRSVTATFASANFAFVSQPTVIAGSLGSAAAADTVCQQEADAADLPGTYVAWLSDSSTNAIDRLTGARGWVRLDGRPVIDRPSDLPARSMRYPILFESGGVPVANTNPVMGTSDENGTLLAASCEDFSVMTGSLRAGFASHVGERWARGTIASCGSPGRVYCFGTDHTTPFPIRIPEERRRVFVTDQPWLGLTEGVASADAHCAAEATRAGLLGTFIAFLSTTRVPAIDRIDPTGPVYTRMDGVPLANSSADFVAGDFLTSPAQDQFLNFPANFPVVGAGRPDQTGSPALNCDDFSSATESGARAASDSALNPFLGPGPGLILCTAAARFSVYCIEQ